MQKRPLLDLPFQESPSEHLWHASVIISISPACEEKFQTSLPIQEWQDINLKWNKSDYGQIGDIRIPPKYIWKPDLLMYNRSVCEASIYSFANSLFPVLTKLLTGRITRM